MCGTADFAALDLMLTRIMLTTVIAIASAAAYKMMPIFSGAFDKESRKIKE